MWKLIKHVIEASLWDAIGQPQVVRIGKPIYRYIKIFITKQLVSIIIIASVISNIHTLYLNNQYNNFHNRVQSQVEFTALVISESIEKEYNYQYIIKGKESEYKNKKFLLYVKKDKNKLLKYGDLIKINGEFNIPEGQRNYKGFDYKEYLKTKKIYGSIVASNSKIEVIDANKSNVIFTISNNIRRAIIGTARQILPQKTRGLLLGILIRRNRGST